MVAVEVNPKITPDTTPDQTVGLEMRVTESTSNEVKNVQVVDHTTPADTT